MVLWVMDVDQNLNKAFREGNVCRSIGMGLIMNISQVAQICGLSTKAIRYYEDLGLVIPARDVNNSYRVYSHQDVERLSFLRRAKAVGFELDVCRELLALYVNPARRCAQVKSLVLAKMQQVDQQVETLLLMRASLAQMAAECTGDDSSDCAIIDRLSGSAGSSAVTSATMAFTLLGEVDPR